MNPPEEKELDLNKLEDVDFLIDNAVDLHQEILAYEKTAESGKKLREEIFDAQISIEELKYVAGEIKGEITKGTFDIKDEQVDTIQGLYTDLLVTRNKLFDEYGVYTEEKIEHKVKPDHPAQEVANPYVSVAKEMGNNIDLDKKSTSKRKDLNIKADSGQGEILDIQAKEQKKNNKASKSASKKKKDIKQKLTTSAVKKSQGKNKKYIVDDSYGYYKKVAESKEAEKDSFEKYVLNEAKKYEDSTIGAFDKWLDEERGDAYTYLKDMTLSEIEQLSATKDIRSTLEDEKIKYETFVAWLDLLFEMKEGLAAPEDVTLEELFTEWLIQINAE